VAERRPRRIPVCTLAIVGAAALISAGPAPLAAASSFQRGAILSGELWRLGTGHLWHGSFELAAWDLGALGLLGAWVELRSRTEWLAVVTLAALGSGIAVLALRPDLVSYQGSSALSSALLANACLHALSHGADRALRIAAASALLALAAKILLETAGRSPGFALASTGGLESVALAHLAGALAGGGVRGAFALRSARGAATSTAPRSHRAGAP
jgi:hypothetical protein